MNTVIFHCVSGDAFFGGFLAVAAGAILIWKTQGKRHRVGAALILLGWIFVIVSATALPEFQYFCLAIVSLRVVVGNPRKPKDDSKESATAIDQSSKPESWKTRWCPTLCIIALGTACVEFVAHHPSQVPISRDLPIVVIGDSLSAGINDGVDIPWPTCLDKMTSAKVSNNALAGATCHSAINQLENLPEQCVVIVEIGGNDLLGGRSSAEFRKDLDELLSEIKRPGRDIVMFELPLPPLFNGYGSTQRELADVHNVALIPRRLLAAVLFTEDATLDSIHLSNDGHQQLAERIALILGLDNLE
ncbi:MAG: acyl-CoA thioesterase-1 [Planctomycetaceae bacterium]|jgi:acyl-CoA thioesterase-1